MHNALPEVPILVAIRISFIKRTREATENGLQESVPCGGLWPVFLQLLDSRQDALPILARTQQCDMGDAAKCREAITEIGPQSSHHENAGNDDVIVCCGLEIWHNPITESRVDHILVDETSHFLRHVAEVYGIPISGGMDSKLLLSFVCDEERAKLFSTSRTIDEEVELSQDTQPDIVGTEDERMMIIVSVDYGVYKTIRARSKPSGWLEEGSGLWNEWRLQKLINLLSIPVTGPQSTQQSHKVYIGRLAVILVDIVTWGRTERDGHLFQTMKEWGSSLDLEPFYVCRLTFSLTHNKPLINCLKPVGREWDIPVCPN